MSVHLALTHDSQLGLFEGSSPVGAIARDIVVVNMSTDTDIVVPRIVMAR